MSVSRPPEEESVRGEASKHEIAIVASLARRQRGLDRPACPSPARCIFEVTTI